MVLLKSARDPLAVLEEPSELFWSADLPLAVLLLPVVLLKSAAFPLAVLVKPVVCSGARRLPPQCCFPLYFVIGPEKMLRWSVQR